MRLKEFEAPQQQGTDISQDVKDIITILQTTDNPKMLPFVSKNMDAVVAEPDAPAEVPQNTTADTPITEPDNQEEDNPVQTEDSQANVAGMIKKLEALSKDAFTGNKKVDTDLLHRIASQIKIAELREKVDTLWDARNFNHKQMIKYKLPFLREILGAGASVQSKIVLLNLLTVNDEAIPASIFSKNFKTDISAITPSKIANNKAYQLIQPTIFSDDTFRGKGVGAGEFALALLGKEGNRTTKQGDISIGGWGIEVKGGGEKGGGSIKTGSPTKFRGADKLRTWIARQVGVRADKDFRLHWAGRTKQARKNAGKSFHSNEFTDKYNSLPASKKKQITTTYIEKLYQYIPPEAQQELINGIMKDAGTQKVKTHFGRVLIPIYKQIDGWDSICFINTGGDVVNMIDEKKADQWLNIQLQGLNRDKDVQSLADGFVTAEIR